MRKLFVSIVTCVMMTLLACQDAKESDAPFNDISSYKKIGMQISYETGVRWIETYNQKNNIQEDNISGRRVLSPYAISAGQLQAAIASVNSLVGVAFHHAVDDNGEHHFIVIPVDESLHVWTDIPGRAYIDANTNTEITREVARGWAQNYEEAHAGEIWFHFFGSNIFDEIFAVSYFSTLNIVPALKTSDLTPQLLLMIINEQLSITGRTADADDPLVYDASSPCPPCPVEP